MIKDPPADAKKRHVLTVDWPLWEQAGRQPKIMVKTDHPKAPSMTMLIKRALNANNPTGF